VISPPPSSLEKEAEPVIGMDHVRIEPLHKPEADTPAVATRWVE
jgi:hypothetical protein